MEWLGAKMVYINNPLLRPDKLEYREYQTAIAVEALQDNSLIVLPTGMGKTPVLLQVIMAKWDEVDKILIMAPTRPLVEQHRRFFRAMLADEPSDFVEFVHGLVQPAEREKIYHFNKVIITTPQTARHDIEEGILDPRRFGIVCFDECHRAVGEYDYCHVAALFRQAESKALMIGMTASPGTDQESVDEVCMNLGLNQRLVRTKDDPDVVEYVQPTPEEVVRVPLDPLVEEPVKRFRRLAQKTYDRLNETGRPEVFRERLGDTTSKSRVLKLIESVGASLKASRNPRMAGQVTASPKLFMVMRDLAMIVKIRHAIEMGETQGSVPMYDYLIKLKEGDKKADAMITSSDEYKLSLRQLSASMFRDGTDPDPVTPKLKALTEIVMAEFEKDPESRVLVFTTYRNALEVCYRHLKRVGDGTVRPARFVGQADGRSNRGMSQQTQRKVVQEFRDGKFNVLIATSVGEEGIDIPGCNLVVFHEPPNSAIRHIQRRGRTGRFEAGRCVILVAKGSTDEAYLQANRRGERNMQTTLTSRMRQEDFG